MNPIQLPSPSSTERNRLLNGHAVRTKTLDRLYQRRDAVDQLIRSLEDYMRSTEASEPECLDNLARHTA